MKDKEAACDECGTLTKNIMRRKIHFHASQTCMSCPFEAYL